jgi:hypothetical protein
MNFEEQVDKFSDILNNFMEKKRHELHELHKQNSDEDDDHKKWFDRESKYIRYFLRWLKEYRAIPVELKMPCPCGGEIAQESEFCNECRKVGEERGGWLYATSHNGEGAFWGNIKEDKEKYKDECDKICEEIGLKYLRLERLPHCSSLQHEQEEFIVMDNPCTGGHVINQLALPIALLKKCLVLGCVPALAIDNLKRI